MVFIRQFLVTTILALKSCGVAMSDEETTAGGSKVLRYQQHKHEFSSPSQQAEHVEELTTFLTGVLGPSPIVWHEIVSDKIHLDVLPFPPTADRPYWTFVTSGMSDLAMRVPENVEDPDNYRFAELVISLPPEWFPREALETADGIKFDDENYWPIRLLKQLARFPHEYQTWIWALHSFPNGNPAQPYAVGTKMNGAILLPPSTWPPSLNRFRRRDDATVHFLGIYPLYAEEMNVKLEKGSDALLELLEKSEVTEILNPARPSLVRKSAFWGLFRN
jgi:hypothetical protein